MYGIDISEDMKKTASKRNRKALENNQLFLETGDCCNLPYEENMLSGVSSIYQPLHQIKHVLASKHWKLKVSSDESSS